MTQPIQIITVPKSEKYYWPVYCPTTVCLIGLIPQNLFSLIPKWEILFLSHFSYEVTNLTFTHLHRKVDEFMICLVQYFVFRVLTL